LGEGEAAREIRSQGEAVGRRGGKSPKLVCDEGTDCSLGRFQEKKVGPGGGEGVKTWGGGWGGKRRSYHTD